MAPMAASDPIPVLVLAGGASRRMGTDKRLLPIDGVPMLRRTLERLAPAPCLVIVDPRRPPPIALPDHARLVSDTRPGEGPLAALEAGLRAADSHLVGVVAGDMPWVRPTVLALLALRLSVAPDATVACLADERGPQPLPLALRRERVLPHVTTLLDRGTRQLRALLAGAVVVEPASWRMVDPAGDTLRDVDTPADLAPTS